MYLRYLLAGSLVLLCSCGGGQRQSRVEPEGRDESAKTNVLEAGAKVLQRSAPLAGMDIYLVGLHPMKNEPLHQTEAHHFCRQVNEDFAQCALFDGNQADANLTGIEYIISEKLFESLPAEERKYWHPHNYEILSGQLQAPGIPTIAEKELMRSKMNSYGKTWHVWMSNQGHTLPFGDAKLAWSANRDGELKPELITRLESRFANIAEKREERKELTNLARPQEGVDVLKDKFPGPLRTIPGVVDKSSAAK